MNKMITKLLLGVVFVLGAVAANAQTNYFSKAAATDFTDVNSWGTNADGSGASPGAITNLDNYTIQNGSVMNLSAGSAAVRTLTINAGSLTIGTNTLTVAIAAQCNSTLAINSGGTLTVSGGILNLNGSMALAAGGKFNQSGGNINVDGNNAGVTATSVASGTAIVSWSPTAIADITLTGGTFTIVDPHAATTITNVFVLSASPTGSLVASTSHTFQFGDGVSTDAGGNVLGFQIQPWSTTTGLKFGNIVFNGPAGTNRIFTLLSSFGALVVGGNITVNSGADLRQTGTSATSGAIYCNGNLTVDGSFTSLGTVRFENGTHTGSTTIGVAASPNAQIVSGAGTFRNLTTPTAPTANFTSLLINNSNAAGVTFANANSLLSGAVNGTVSGTFTLTAGVVNTGANALILGTGTGALGTFTYTNGGFTSGSTFGRWYAASTPGTTITAGAVPAIGTGSYPFLVGTNSRNFHINRPAVTGATGGVIRVSHTDGIGLNTIAPVLDVAYSIDRQTVANWTVSTSNGFAAGTGTFSYAVSGQGTFSITNTNTRVMKVATVVGTHQNGTSLPHGQRGAIAAADYTGTFYLGISSVDLPIVTAQSGPWEDPATWTGGIVPICGNNAVIQSGHTVTVNAVAANTGGLQVSAGGTLAVSANTLTVGCTNNNNSLVNSGTLTVSAGALVVNGNINNTAGSSFTHSGGNITIDGNSGTAGTSVATGTPLLWFQSNTVTLNGGTLTIVDPHIGAAGADRAITYAPSSSPYPTVTTGHTTQFGDGVSTTTGGAQGFEVGQGTRLQLGNVIVNTLQATSAARSSGNLPILGNLTITAGEFSTNANTLVISGNIINSGTLTTNGTLYFGSYTLPSTLAPSANAQTVSGSGVFRNLTASPTSNFASVTVNNTNAAGVTFSNANSLLSGANTGTVSGTLTMTTGFVNTGANALILGVSAAATGTLSYTAGGFASGSTFSRWWGTATGGATITAGTTPSGTAAGVYPFAIGAPGSFTARNLYLNQTVAATTGGKIAVTYTDVAGTSAVAIVDAGPYTVDLRSNGNWAVAQTGITGTPTYTMAINAQNLYAASNGNSRITLAAAPSSGSHQNGTTYPNAQRLAMPLASLVNAYYIGINSADVPFISVANGNWEDGTTWNKNPAVPSATDAVIISNATTVTVNSIASAAAGVTVNSGGTLTVSGSTLNITNALTNNGTFNASGGTTTVTAASGTGITNAVTTGTFTVNGGTVNLGVTDNTACNRLFTNNGTLTVSSGTLNIYGRLLVNLLSTFNQSGGNINVDGNAGGVAANSVASGIAIVDLNPSTLTSINLTGGTLTLVDPHANTTASNTLLLSGATAGPANVTNGHTIRFGNGVSTDAGGNATNGFRVNTWSSTTGMPFGNVIVEGPAGTNRYVTGTYQQPILGNMTVNSGGENAIALIYVNGNILVNAGGTYTSASGLNMTNSTFVDGSTVSFSPSANAQTIGGGGTFRNLSASPTANLTNLTVNNNNATGLTLNIPLSVSGTLLMTTGLINTTSTNLLSLGTATVAGTLSGTPGAANMIVGPFARTFAASRTATGTYDATTLFPVGKGASYLPVNIDPSTTAGGSVILSGEAFTTNTGTQGAGVTSLSSNRWEALVTTGGANLANSFLRLNDAAIVSTNKILQAPSGAGVYTGVPVASTFTSGTPNTLATASAIPAAGYQGYFAYGDLTPCITPADQPTVFGATGITTTTFTGSFTLAASTPSHYLVVRYPTGSAVTAPVNNTSYAPGATLGLGTVVTNVVSPANTYNATGLTAGTTYDIYIYSFNNSACFGPVYNTVSPLQGVVTTCATATGTPGTPTSSLITTTSFTATWAASSTAGVDYILDVATNNTFTTFVAGYNALNVGTGTLSYNVNTGLSANTPYYVRVRAVIGGCTSANSGTLTVTTLCNPSSLPYLQNFDGVTAPAIPSCHTVTNDNGDSRLWVTSTSIVGITPASAPNQLSILYNTDGITAMNDWFFTPGFNLTNGTTYQVKFKYRNDGGTTYPEKLEVKYGNAPNAGSMTTSIVDLLISGVSSYTQASYTFTPSSTGVYYIGFWGHSDADMDILGIDDIEFDVAPSCLPPTGVSAGPVTSGTADINFTSGGTSFIVEYGAPGFIPGTGASAGAGTIVTGGASPIAISGLTAATSYDVYVRQVCSGPSYSTNSTVVNFTTPCVNSSLPVTEGFNTSGSSTFPSCWSQQTVIGTSDISFETSASDPTTIPFEGTRFAFWNSFASSWPAGNETRLKSPPITTTGTTNVAVSFMWYNNNNSSYSAGAYLNEGVQVQYSLDGTTWTDAGTLIPRHDGTLTVGTGAWKFKSVTLPAGAGNQSTIYVGFKFHSEYGDNCSLDAVNITNAAGFWTGGTSSVYSNSANWADGNPTPTDVKVPQGVPNMPVLDVNASINNLSLGTGTTLSINGNQLTVNGAISGTGALSGSATSNLILAGAAGTLNFDQTSAATRSLNNLTLNAASSATLGSALDVYGTVALTTASLNLNAQNLTLKSNATNTARIADLTGSTLTGATNVTMERYIKLRTGGDGRAYRLLTPTVNTTGSINANWMEGGMNTAIGTNVNPVPNYGTQITGAGGNANGFDKTQSNAPSLYNTANGTTPIYTAIGSTSGNMNALTGYFLYLRGDRSMDMTIPLAPNMPTSSTTLRATGSILQGTQTTFTNAYAGSGALNLVTNPYPSPIDWSLVQPASSGITGSYTYWDANIGTRGGFATVTTAGVSTPATSATQMIQSGQAFFVESNGAVPAVSIQESHKVAGNNNDVFLVPPPPVESFRTELYFTEPNGFRRIADGAIALYDNGYSAAVDAKDSKEINNWDENIAIAREGKHLAIESRPVIAKSDDLPIFMNNMKKQAYEFEFTPLVFTNTSLKAELVDNFLGTRTLLSVTDPTVVAFTITDDPASKATDRFKVVFGQFGNPQGIDAITIKASQKNDGVQVDWTSKTETDMVSYEVERSTYGTSFVKAGTTAALGNSSNPVNYNWFDASPNMGSNFYRIKGIDKAGNVRYSDAVRVLFGKGEPSIVVYPNPLQGNTFKIDMYNLVKGTYTLNLYSMTGQLVYTAQLQHDGSQATKTINLNREIGKGSFQLQLIGGSGFKTTQRIIKN